MKSISVLALVAVAATDAAAQTATIGGLVVDQSGNPLSGIAVLYNRIRDLRTDANGQLAPIPPIVSSQVVTGSQGTFEISGIPAGSYHLCTGLSVPGRLASCLYEPKPVVVPVGIGTSATGVTLVAAAGTTVTVQVTDAAGKIQAGSPFAIGATAVGSAWAFFARLVSQSSTQLTYQMTLPKDYNFQLVVDTPLAVTDAKGYTVVAKQPGMVLATSSGNPITAAFVVN
jgi:hypothetical protein